MLLQLCFHHFVVGLDWFLVGHFVFGVEQPFEGCSQRVFEFADLKECHIQFALSLTQTFDDIVVVIVQLANVVFDGPSFGR